MRRVNVRIDWDEEYPVYELVATGGRLELTVDYVLVERFYRARAEWRAVQRDLEALARQQGKG